MRRPQQTWLVIRGNEAQATFDDPADARAYADDVDGSAETYILCLPHWPAGLWRYGIERPTTSRNNPLLDDLTPQPGWRRVSPVAQSAHYEHMRTNQRCVGAQLDVITARHNPPRYRCQRCGDRIL
jgi:hypothetical protein